MIYVLEAVGCERFKVGFSTDARRFMQRFATIQVGSPFMVKLCAWRDGTMYQEQELHASMSEHRIHGEWFRPNRKLTAFIALNRGTIDDLKAQHDREFEEHSTLMAKKVSFEPRAELAPPPPTPDAELTIQEASTYLNVRKCSIRQLLAGGYLHHVPNKMPALIKRSELDAYLEQCSTNA